MHAGSMVNCCNRWQAAQLGHLKARDGALNARCGMTIHPVCFTLLCCLIQQTLHWQF